MNAATPLRSLVRGVRRDLGRGWGYVYIMQSVSRPWLRKVGRTRHDPRHRRMQLDDCPIYGRWGPWRIESYLWAHNHGAVEREAHRRLRRVRFPAWKHGSTATELFAASQARTEAAIGRAERTVNPPLEVRLLRAIVALLVLVIVAGLMR